MTRYCGEVDPRDLKSSQSLGGFAALAKARDTLGPEGVIAEVKTSGLRGRGGAGFPCGVKWELARQAPGEQKYLICNADEGEMGTFKDRYLIEHDPFTLVEGVAIAALAVGAGRAFIYLRDEYHRLLPLLAGAVDQAKTAGLLAGLDLEIVEGAGAYVCGEETALMNSIEGRRGEARFRPPFPPQSGLWAGPTIINNVETLMNLPAIIGQGGQWYAGLGTDQSKGSKVFSVSGDVARPGVYELVMGSTLRELVMDLAGAAEVQMVQVGGAPGRIVPGSGLDTPLGYETMLGSGAVVVLDNSRDVIELLRGDLEFLAEESCGKCAPCREGTQVMIEILDRLAVGDGEPGDLQVLRDLAAVMSDAALCGLGQGAPVPVLDALTHFRPRFDNRINVSGYIRRL